MKRGSRLLTLIMKAEVNLINTKHKNKLMTWERTWVNRKYMAQALTMKMM
ncbi:hypothetical protein F2Q69_00015338 [Brassica cretica]|uniref:Uncharacterized protein n=1 Tax=Brassica cretica TaxID=69181 RepID=A0A8S9QSZ7_BRACR|nr:hypothetical protein F2Q69_00015338 [Brassica cretica]